MAKHTADNIDRLNNKWSALPEDYRTFTQGELQEVPNPFYPSLPTGFVVLRATDADGTPIPAPVVTVEPAQRDGFVGLTADFVGGDGTTGYVGERISGFLANADAITLTTNVAANATSISLTPGTWDVSCIGEFGGALTGTRLDVGISGTSATLPGTATLGDAQINTPTMPTANSNIGLAIPGYRVTLTSTTPYYLVVRAIFTVGTALGYGRISATRAVTSGSGVEGVVYGYLVGP